jgi:hypothetical protein
MLHLVLSTPRSGSNSLCKFLELEHNAINLYEPVTDNRSADNDLLKPIEQIVKETLALSRISTTVAKFHVDHLLLLYPHKIDLIIELLKSSKIYYCLRLDFSDQIKSIAGIKHTGICDTRSKPETIDITGLLSLDISLALSLEISIMGEWFKHFPGQLAILEDMEGSYSKYRLNRYDDIYNYTYDSANTKQFVEQYVDVLEIFSKGNPIYKIFGD